MEHCRVGLGDTNFTGQCEAGDQIENTERVEVGSKVHMEIADNGSASWLRRDWPRTGRSARQTRSRPGALARCQLPRLARRQTYHRWPVRDVTERAEAGPRWLDTPPASRTSRTGQRQTIVAVARCPERYSLRRSLGRSWVRARAYAKLPASAAPARPILLESSATFHG